MGILAKRNGEKAIPIEKAQFTIEIADVLSLSPTAFVDDSVIKEVKHPIPNPIHSKPDKIHKLDML